MWTGKILGFLIGLAVAGPVGALIGLVVGHFFDVGRAGIHRYSYSFDPKRRAQLEQTFFTTLFSLLGHLAKADGRISESEVSDTEQLMTRMGLNADDRQRAIALFKQGASPGFDLNGVLVTFNRECGRFNNMKQMLLVYLISLALADGDLQDEEKRVLEQVALGLGYSAGAFRQILRMALAQTRFYRYSEAGSRQRQHYHQAPPSEAEELATAYEAIGVNASASDTEVKRAYRRLMSQYHPDKVTGRGVPDDMIDVATERAQEIQAAYDIIKKRRNIR